MPAINDPFKPRKPKTKTITQIGRVKVYERGDGKFTVKFPDHTGNWRNQTRTDRPAAIAFANEKHQELDRGKWVVVGTEAEILRIAKQLPNALEILQAELRRLQDRNSVTVADLAARVKAHYEDLAAEDIGRRITANDASSRMSKVATDLGHYYLDSLRGEHVLAWLKSMQCTPRNRRNNLQALRNAIRLAKAWQLVPSGYDPTEPDRINAANFPALLRSRRVDPTIWTREEFDAALAAVPEHHLRMFLVLGGCLGMRPAEAAGVVGERDGLDWSAINWKARTVAIDRDTVKTGRARKMDFRPRPHDGWTEEVTELVWKRFVGLAFPVQVSGPICPRKAQRMLSVPVRAALGRPWDKDALRHTWISALLGLGVHKDTVARLAGNSVGEIDRSYENPMDHAQALEWFAP